jgi:uncharacterized protein with FMN-binding domain
MFKRTWYMTRLVKTPAWDVRMPRLTVVSFTLCLILAMPAAGDVVELLSGSRIEGEVTNIDKAGRQVTFRRMISGKPYTTTYPYSKIHAVTLGERRYVITEKSEDSPVEAKPVGKPATGSAAGRQARAAIEALIEQQGTTPPDWFDGTPLNFPNTLDLAWPEPAPQGWNNQQNVGQYVWDIINPNPPRWKEGTRFMHHLLTVHRDNPEVQLRVMNTLGRFYHDLLEDYPRAAFWWQKAGVHTGQSKFVHSGPHLAACYYRMGNKDMAVELLNKLEHGSVSFGLIKAWGEIGEPKKAMQLADAFIRGRADTAAISFMYAGDACRTNGLLEQAIGYYQKVLDQPAEGQMKGRIEREHQRARASLEAIRLFEQLDLARIADGRYEASSMGYEGPVKIAVSVQRGRIEDVRVTEHREKQFYSAMTDTPAKILKKQHVKGIDTTSSATLTSEAIINATAKALAAAPRR